MRVRTPVILAVALAATGLTIQSASAAQSTSIDDAKFTYTGTWTAAPMAGKYGGSDHWSITSGSTASVSFVGTGVTLYGAKVADHGTGEISFDGKKVGQASWKGATRQNNVPIVKLNGLAAGRHTLMVTVPGNGQSLAVNVDRIVVDGGASATQLATGTRATTTPKVTTPAKPKTATTPKSVTAPKPVTSAGSAAPVPAGYAKFNSSKSGLKWASGAFGADDVSKAQQLGQWRGRPIDVVAHWGDYTSWGGMAEFGDVANANVTTIAVGLPPFPQGSGGSNAQCAAGAYNSQWKTIANSIKSSGIGNKLVIRLGWEFSGDWDEWAANNPGDFAKCWQQVVPIVKGVNPGVKFDWNVASGNVNGINGNVLDAYPGDQYVDIVGIDVYDSYPPVNQGGWNEQKTGEYRIDYWVNFAKKHNKPVSFPEWGLATGSQWKDSEGGDDPQFIQEMWNEFNAIAPMLAYESYFDEPAEYLGSSLYNPTQVPKAAALYKQLWTAGSK